MKLRLVRGSEALRPLILEMLDEWNAAGEKIIPYAIRKADPHGDFATYLASLEVSEAEAAAAGLVPDSTFFCLDEGTGRLVGAVSIRHRLNEALLLNGGHIGDGVRPSARGKGVATAMIALALDECRALGLDRVLMVCDKENAASARTIQKNGGVLENEVTVGGVTEQRYWLEL